MRYLNKSDFDNLGNNDKFKKICGELYSDVNDFDYQVNRYKELYDLHKKFSENNILMFSSPGRIEVIGNHTDHNNGMVICASISVDTIACVTPCNDDSITVASVGYPSVTIDINNLEQNKNEFGTSEALIRGVCNYYKNNGFNIGGFYATTTSDVFKGAGVSSSACFEVLICEILNTLYNDSKIDPVTKAYASHHAEQDFFGKPCGLMDQSAIALGNVSYIDFKNTKMPVIKTLNWDFDYDIILTNCGGDHANLTEEYASIRKDMEQVAGFCGQKNLRELDEKKFYMQLPKMQSKIHGKALLRAIHYYNENRRVVECADAIASGKKLNFAKKIKESGESSYMLLQNCFPEGDKIQRIPLALALVKNCVKTAVSRVHGGGFAGTIISYCLPKDAQKTINVLSKVFSSDSVYKIKIRHAGTCLIEI